MNYINKFQTKSLQSIGNICIVIFMCFIIAGIGGSSHADIYGTRNIVFDGKTYAGEGYYYKGTPYIKAYSSANLSPISGVTLDYSQKSLRIDAAIADIKMADSYTTQFVKSNAGILEIPFATINNEYYIPLNTAGPFLGVNAALNGDNIVIAKTGMLQVGETEISKGATILNSLLSQKSPGVSSLITQNSPIVKIISETDNMYHIQKSDGNTAYVMKFDTGTANAKNFSQGFYAPKKNKILKRNPSIAWQYVNKYTPEAPTKKSGIDILAPTWFSLNINSDGSVNGKADKGYSDMAHKNGYDVWATITNSMSTTGAAQFTSRVMSETALCNKSIAQYIFYAALYDVDGINIDFENLLKTDRENLVSYTKKFRELSERQGLVLSIDVMIPSKWNSQYNRGELSKHVDYVALMAYDEHYRGSSKAGSVSSIPWVENAILSTLREGVPKDKLLLGVPMYTRLWGVNPDGSVSSVKTKTMSETASITEDYKNLYGKYPAYLDKTGQNYIEYTEGNITYKLWLEDQISMKNRLALIRKYSLAGIAAWQYDHTNDAIWDTIAQEL